MNRLIVDYFSFRGWPAPPAPSTALMWLFREVGELAHAFLVWSSEGMSREMVALISEMISVGVRAERIAGGLDYDRAPTLEYEIGDVRMLLGIFASQVGLHPDMAMLARMRSKGFDAREDDAALTVATIAAIVGGDAAPLSSTEVIREVRKIVGWF